ncbi:MAG: hypothetical protein IJ710_10045 [Prevotella sp.]|nr:hypothetical protein [Prevotella sp.]
MDRSLIKKHNFDKAKAHIQSFSNKLPSNPAFERVEVDGGLFGWGDHKVTGSEMNNFIGKVQDRLISVNDSLRKIVKEFREVYSAFDSLDTEYISGILSSVEAAEKASGEALTAQKDINRTIEGLVKTASIVTVLKEDVEKLKKAPLSIENEMKAIVADIISLQQHKNKLASIVHLNDIDLIWDDINTQRENMSVLQSQTDNYISTCNQALSTIDNEIKSLQAYRTVLEGYSHLSDIDEMWQDLAKQKDGLSSLNAQLGTFINKTEETTSVIGKDLSSLQDFQKVIEDYKHLPEIDKIWESVEHHKGAIISHIQKLEWFDGEINKVKQDIVDSTENLAEKMASNYDIMKRRTTIAYILSGCSISLLIAYIIMNLLGIL